MKKYISIITLLTLMIFLVSCQISPDNVTEDITNNIESTNKTTLSVVTIDNTCYLTGYEINNNGEIDESNVLPPTSEGNILTFDSIQEFQSKLEELSFSETEINALKKFPQNDKGIIIPSPDSMKTINSVPEGYKESSVEWAGYSDYVINFISKNQIGLSFHMYNNEEDLNLQQIDSLKYMGNYKELKNNEGAFNLKVEYVMSEFGEIEISTYDTDVAKNYKRTYIEFSYNNIKYVISEFYAPDGSLLYALTFAYNGDQSFSCYNDGEMMSYKDIVSFKADIVK